ncbi:LPP20 family lipoprotein [Aliiglaciecola sp. CAU 1673]|uniref:LPP20 family lipoprotein n=1 Tax=Aliiglaciecola sp. CAU 1673 TaxID=3032595 RepID=UPI0023DB5B56|nr:LPP20 family lipoprotein [Aliiglaciecola sp. CAU 1673]MDF2178334.1 LPP20 family lipoprotein [Aliiglaciecola sp. CAU 1673]
MAFFVLTGCSTFFDKHVEWEYVEPEEYPVLTAIGYAPIDAQRGNSDSVKMLQAVKASKLDAYRELAEQVYGHKLSGQETLSDMVLQDARLKSNVDGVIRGARIVKSYPIGDDTYATELELDMRRVYDIYLSTAKPKRIRDVKYY